MTKGKTACVSGCLDNQLGDRVLSEPLSSFDLRIDGRESPGFYTTSLQRKAEKCGSLDYLCG